MHPVLTELRAAHLSLRRTTIERGDLRGLRRREAALLEDALDLRASLTETLDLFVRKSGDLETTVRMLSLNTVAELPKRTRKFGSVDRATHHLRSEQFLVG